MEEFGLPTALQEQSPEPAETNLKTDQNYELANKKKHQHTGILCELEGSSISLKKQQRTEEMEESDLPSDITKPTETKQKMDQDFELTITRNHNDTLMLSELEGIRISSEEQIEIEGGSLVRPKISTNAVRQETHKDEIRLSTDEIKSSKKINCNPCLTHRETNEALVVCKTCEEYLCEPCYVIHKKLKATKDHEVIDIEETVHSISQQKCDPCKYSFTDAYSSCFCTVCEEYLCNACQKAHEKFKATRNHVIVSIEDSFRYKNILNLECGVCDDGETPQQAIAFCTECLPPELFCSDCLVHHKAIKTTRNHSVSYDLKQFKRDLTSKGNTENLKGSDYDNLKERDQLIPGTPILVDSPKADSIQLRWNPPKEFIPSYQYQIRFKSTSPSDIWTFYDEQYTENTVILENMKSDTTFTFQVRMVNSEDEGPYSKTSEPITTKRSAANHLIEFTKVVSTDADGVIAKRKLLLEEDGEARNRHAKTRKFYLGKPSSLNCTEKTLLLVGATGSGKSTLVDGFINYILGVNWDDPFRFTLVDLEEDEKGIQSNQAVSQTQWITSYCINPLEGSRLDYKLNIIDTPGFGDTRGFERDQEIVDQIRQLFSASDETGVVYLDAVCFLTKAPDARLTPTQRYIFNAILSLFGQDIAENINILVTFADGKTPPVLAALKEAELPLDVFFLFNNSGLFADNRGPSMSCLSPIFWEMGLRSFAEFFEHLKTMSTKSLKQTKEVLEQRNQLEITIENLTPLVSNGLHKLDELSEEIRILEQHKTEIEANKNFTYTVTETNQIKIDLPRGLHVTNCLNCNITCHKNCKISNDERKYKCSAMDNKGYCTQCIDNCSWQQHANTPYIFEYVQEEKTKTYAEKMKKYRNASGEKMTHEKVVYRMWDELQYLEHQILLDMDTITSCNNTLKDIALRPNPLSVKEHIELLIEGEKQEHRPGFQRRISVLMSFRKKCNIRDDVDRFRKDLFNTRNHSMFHAKATKSKKEGTHFFDGLMFWK